MALATMDANDGAAPPASAVVGPKANQSKKAKKVDAEDEGKARAQRRGPVPLKPNVLFEQCYRGTVVPQDEWSNLMAALARDLPVTFRFAGAHPLSRVLAERMELDFVAPGAFDFGEIGVAEDAGNDGDGIEEGAQRQQTPSCKKPLSKLPWLDGAWRLDIPKTVLRKAPGPKRLHEFIKRCVALGAICRQEAVSMVPVALLRGGAGLHVLDVCGSPGMKALQLLDAAGASSLTDAPASVARILNGGAVVANDLDGRRVCMLAHHVLRVRHPSGLVIHHNATALPALGGKFDCVLCDVPCSGDGTIRKAPQLLASWRPNRANALHTLQVRIACAAAAQLAVGGRMVYSTCALSPVENEAVVAALLLNANGALELVDVDNELEGLLRRPGLECWEVYAGARRCKEAVALRSPEDAAARGIDIPPSAWPPTPSGAAARLGLPGILRRCWRFLPHVGDGGGFFVAVLRRVSAEDVPLCPATPPSESTRGEASSGACEVQEGDEEDVMPDDAVCKEALPEAQREAFLVPVSASEKTRSLVEAALDFYGLDVPIGNFFARIDGDGRNIYLVSDGVRDVLTASSGETTPRLRVMVGGVRVFDENRFLKGSGCSLRLCQEGACWLAPLMRRRCCNASPEEMLELLDGKMRLFTDFVVGSRLRQSLEDMDTQGSVAIVCTLPDGAGSISAVAERGAECVCLFVNQHEMRELRETLEAVLAPPAAEGPQPAKE